MVNWWCGAQSSYKLYSQHYRKRIPHNGHFVRGNPSQRAIDIVLWLFLCYLSKQAFEYKLDRPVIWGATTLIWHPCDDIKLNHNNDVIMCAIASQITSLTIGFSTVYLDTNQRKHQSSVSLAFVRGIHRRPVNSPHKWPVTRKMFPLDDVIMTLLRFFYPTKSWQPA